VLCIDKMTGGGYAVTASDKCHKSENAGEMPGSEGICHGTGVCQDWTVGEWGACSGECGNANRTRQVSCHGMAGSCDEGKMPQDKEACTGGAWSNCQTEPPPTPQPPLEPTPDVGAEAESIMKVDCPCDGEDITLPVAGVMNGLLGWNIGVTGVQIFVRSWKSSSDLASRWEENRPSWMNYGVMTGLVHGMDAMQHIMANPLSPVNVVLAAIIALLVAWLLGAGGLYIAALPYDGVTPGVPDIIVSAGRLAVATVALITMGTGGCTMAAPTRVAPNCLWILGAVILVVIGVYALCSLIQAEAMAYWAHVTVPEVDLPGGAVMLPGHTTVPPPS
jgi:hypothetical protein